MRGRRCCSRCPALLRSVGGLAACANGEPSAVEWDSRTADISPSRTARNARASSPTTEGDPIDEERHLNELREFFDGYTTAEMETFCLTYMTSTWIGSSNDPMAEGMLMWGYEQANGLRLPSPIGGFLVGSSRSASGLL